MKYTRDDFATLRIEVSIGRMEPDMDDDEVSHFIPTVRRTVQVDGANPWAGSTLTEIQSMVKNGLIVVLEEANGLLRSGIKTNVH